MRSVIWCCNAGDCSRTGPLTWAVDVYAYDTKVLMLSILGDNQTTQGDFGLGFDYQEKCIYLLPFTAELGSLHVAHYCGSTPQDPFNSPRQRDYQDALTLSTAFCICSKYDPKSTPPVGSRILSSGTESHFVTATALVKTRLSQIAARA